MSRNRWAVEALLVNVAGSISRPPNELFEPSEVVSVFCQVKKPCSTKPLAKLRFSSLCNWLEFEYPINRIRSIEFVLDAAKAGYGLRCTGVLPGASKRGTGTLIGSYSTRLPP